MRKISRKKKKEKDIEGEKETPSPAVCTHSPRVQPQRLAATYLRISKGKGITTLQECELTKPI